VVEQGAQFKAEHSVCANFQVN